MGVGGSVTCRRFCNYAQHRRHVSAIDLGNDAPAGYMLLTVKCYQTFLLVLMLRFQLKMLVF